MKNKLLPNLFLLCFSCGLSASTVYFDLEDTYVVGSGWNTVADYGAGVHVVNAVDSTGTATSVAYNCVDGFVLSNSSGDSGVTVYPIEAGKDSFYLSSANNYAKILIGGLTPGSSYDFNFFASRASSGPRAINIAIGAQSVYLDAAYNTSTVVSISGVIADAGGVVEIEVSLASNSIYGYLGVIEINGEFGEPVVDEPGIFVAPWGSDSNPGTYSWPKGTMQGAADAVAEYKQTNGLPEGGMDVYFRGGHYYFSATTILNDQHSGEAGKPVTFKPYNNEKVVFDGSVVINSSGFSEVTDPLVLDRMGDGATGNVYGCYITDTSLRNQLSEVYAVLDLDGRMAQVSRYPNVGNCHIASVLDEGAIYAHGRTPGDPPTYDMDNPIGAEFTLIETNAARWETEFAVVQKAQVTGYLSNDWYKETHRIADINSGVIKLLEYSRYGVTEGNTRRLYVLNFLCELDSPGEFYFDEAANMLYVWPYEPITAESNIGVWNGPEFLKLYCSYVNFEDLIIQGTTQGGSGSGMVTFYEGDHVNFLGCTFRNTSRPAVSFMQDCSTTNSGIIGCDLYDAASHLNLYGGVADAGEITPAGNYAINCHFTQVQSRDYLGRIYARGVGNIFRNNLIHNLPDNPVLSSGNDNIVELNEIFNCGFESGDGGAMYWANAMWTYGNVFRHNFLHHLMCTPGFHARAGFYADQLDAGDTFEENVFFKAAHRSVLLNGGAGHSVLRNVFLNGNIGVYQTEGYAQRWYDDIPLYDDGTLTRGDVGDFIWRTEQVVGPNGWNNEPWLSHYPTFVVVMNQEMMRFWPIENYFIGNMFYGNSESNFQYRYSSSSVTTDITSTPSYIHKSENMDISMDIFENPDMLNFKFNEPRPSYAPDIPFENVGLYIGDGRKRVPDKNLYRKMVKDRFEGRASYDASASYDPATITDLIYWNSGQILMDLQNAGDFDGDSKVNLLDYSIFSSQWNITATGALWSTKSFDDFAPGALTAQNDWEAHPSVSVVETNDDVHYTGGRALKANSYGDEWTRASATAPNLGIDPSGTDAVKISFDVREGTHSTEGTTLFGGRMFLREAATGNYSPSFGVAGGKMVLRPEGEQGDTIEGNNLASSTYYGTDKYWQKGDWLRVSLILSGENLRYATVGVHNLSQNGMEIPTGISNVDVGRDLESAATLWNRPTFRLNGSVNTYVDNILVGDANDAALTADINKDGVVDLTDFLYLAENWLNH
jgi:hypothetical protein